MAKKNILQKVLLVIAWLVLLETTIRFILGKTDLFSNICLIIMYSTWGLNLILAITQKIYQYKNYKAYRKGFEYLSAVYKARYKLYFTGNKEDIETYSNEIKRYGNAMLNVGQYYVENAKMTKKQRQTISEILTETKKMITTN